MTMQDAKIQEKDAPVSLVPTDTSAPLTPGLEPSAIPVVAVTYTEAEVEAKIRERHSTLDRQIATQQNYLKIASKFDADLKEAKAKIRELTETPDAALSAVEGGVEITKERARLKELERQLGEEKEALNWIQLGRQAELEVADSVAREASLAAIATEFKVPLESLKALPTDSLEAIKSSARILAELQAPVPGMPVDSGTHTGGIPMTPAQANELFAAGKIPVAEWQKATGKVYAQY